VRERERLHNKFLRVHSTLSYIQSPKQQLSIPLAINHTLQPQRGDLETTRTLTLFAFHTTLVRTPSDLTGLHTFYKFRKEQLQESERNILHLVNQESESS